MSDKKEKDPLFDPRQCTYELEPKVRKRLEKLMNSKAVDLDTKLSLVELIEEQEILDYESLVNLHKYYQRADPKYSDPFYVFADSCKCIEPEPRENEALDRRIKTLRMRETQQIYNQLAYHVDRKIRDHQQATGGPSEFKDLYGSVIAVFNSFLVYICTFIFCYKAAEYSMETPNPTVQTMFGFGASLVVAVAEVYFLFRVV